MDTAEIFVTAGGALLIALNFWFFLGARERSPVKAAPYACPMHPWITSSDPGAECSICGMKLVRQG